MHTLQGSGKQIVYTEMGTDNESVVSTPIFRDTNPDRLCHPSHQRGHSDQYAVVPTNAHVIPTSGRNLPGYVEISHCVRNDSVN